MRFFLSTLLLGLTLCLPTTAFGRDPPVAIAPADVHFEVVATGIIARWWQASSANQVVLTTQCAGSDQAIAEPGAPGDHQRAVTIAMTVTHALDICLYIAEYDDARLLGQYGPFALSLARVFLPEMQRP